MRKFFSVAYEFIKKNIFFIMSLAVIVVSFALLFTRYIGSVERVFASVCDFVESIVAYVKFIFNAFAEQESGSIGNSGSYSDVGILETPSVDLRRYIFFDVEDLNRKLSGLNEVLFYDEFFLEYNFVMLDYTRKFLLVALMLIPCFMGLVVLFNQLLLQKNDLLPGTESKPFKIFCKFLECVIYPIGRFFKKFAFYFWKNKFFRYYFCSLWAVSLNVVTICAGAVAYYFFFVSSFDITTVFSQIAKLIIDLIIMFSGLPFIVWLCIGIAIFCYIMINKGYKELKHMEAKNCGFLKSTDYLLLIKGPPGAGKTTLATDFALSWVNIDKTDSLEIMMAMNMLFPAFSFPSLRREINEAIKNRIIWCVPACDAFVDKLFQREAFPYGYRANLFAQERNTGTSHITLQSAVKTYAKAYFIYSNDNSVMSNYPIRFDGRFDDSKHLKKWNGDFFKRHAIKDKEKSRYARILMQDVLRMGKKIDYSNPYIGSFGYGIYVNTEWGKSRGNQLTTEDVKKSDETCNQKNDLYSYALKMCRHVCSTVYHRVFFRFIGDEQRPESLSADQRQLCSILEIVNKSEIKLAIPFGKALDFTYEKLYEPFKDFYLDYLNVRSDVTLIMFLYKSVIAAVSRFYSYLYNTFGYYELELSLEKGSEYGDPNKKSEIKIHKYYLMCKKVYSDRYNTDCHSSYFSKMQLDTKMGMIDYPTYQGLKMSVEEMKKQEDYFINECMSIMNMADEYASQGRTSTVKTVEEPDEDIITL